MNNSNVSHPATKDDIEVAVAQISGAVIKALENVATKDDLKNLASKNDLNKLDHKVDELDHKVEKLSGEVSDIRRLVIDLERDTPTQKEVDDIKKYVGYPPKS